MILGLGNDLCHIERIAATLARFGDQFTRRLFTDEEQAYCLARATPRARAAAFALRFAAKEACAKALGTGFRHGVFWRDIGVSRLASGQPVLVLCGGAQERLNALTPAGMIPRAHLTLSDEPPLAQAVVLLSADFPFPPSPPPAVEPTTP